jgi:hypothetical protein
MLLWWPCPWIPWHSTFGRASQELLLFQRTCHAHNESIRLEYNTAVEAYEFYLLMQSMLKAQIIAAVDHIVIKALEYPWFGFATVSTYQLLTHLITTCSKVLSVHCQKNLVHLAAPWDPSELLLTLWSRVKTCKAVAAAGNVPFRDTQVISIILNVLTNTVVFTSAVNLWQLKNESTWVWTEFIMHVTTHNKLCVNNLTTKTAGYHGSSHYHCATRHNGPGCHNHDQHGNRSKQQILQNSNLDDFHTMGGWLSSAEEIRDRHPSTC